MYRQGGREDARRTAGDIEAQAGWWVQEDRLLAAAVQHDLPNGGLAAGTFEQRAALVVLQKGVGASCRRGGCSLDQQVVTPSRPQRLAMPLHDLQRVGTHLVFVVDEEIRVGVGAAVGDQ